MSIQERKLKNGSVAYWATWRGKWARCGSRAEALEAEQRMKAGETHTPKAVLLRAYAQTWLDGRKNRTAAGDRAMLTQHVLSRPWLASLRVNEVRPRHILQLVSELRERLSDKSISNVLGALRVLFRDAIIQEIAFVQPVLLPKEHLRRRRKVEPEIYQASECVALMRNQHADPRARMLFTLLLCSGMRQGEAVGRCWEDFEDTTPLACMRVATQYDGAPLKTENPRLVPVHPILAEALRWWAAEGFPAVYGRSPSGGPLIPDILTGGPMTKNTSYKLLHREADRIGVKWRGVHATRHTFITLARRGGADKSALEKVTHNARGDIVDGYTRSDWEPLCLAVSCLRFDSDQRLELPTGNSGKNPFLPQREEASFPAHNNHMTQSPARFDSRRLHKWKRLDKQEKESRSIGDQSSQSGRFQTFAVHALSECAFRLGVLPTNRVEEVAS